MYDEKVHLGCGGLLTFNKHAVETVVRKRKVLLPSGKFKIIKTQKEIQKELYLCDKCRMLVSVITCPSWKQYVLSGRIRVPKWRYRLIKEEQKEMKQRRLE